MDEDSGRIAYEAYRAATGGKSLVSGDPLPEFHDLSAAIRRAWTAAAEAVCKRFGAIY